MLLPREAERTRRQGNAFLLLRGEVNPRYAVQYLADVVDVFRAYERMKRFGLTDGVAPPMSAESFRRDSDRMFRWAAAVNEQKRKLR